MTGYELKKFFDTSVAHFWNAELSQIYPALKAMESEGLVEMKVEVQDDRPNRKVYSITDSGRRELLEWLAKPADREQLARANPDQGLLRLLAVKTRVDRSASGLRR